MKIRGSFVSNSSSSSFIIGCKGELTLTVAGVCKQKGLTVDSLNDSLKAEFGTIPNLRKSLEC